MKTFFKVTLTIILFSFTILCSYNAVGQTIGVTKTEEFKADFEKKKDISAYLNYDGPQVPIQILKCGINDETYEMYPELKEKRVGLGVANITLEYLDNLGRFMFTEDKTEIKNRMVKQFQASQAGISEDKLDGRGKIRLAHYFVEIEVYDYSVSEDETINLKDMNKDNKNTELDNTDKKLVIVSKNYQNVVLVVLEKLILQTQLQEMAKNMKLMHGCGGLVCWK